MSPVIRPMTAADWPAVAAIYQQGIDTGLATFETQLPSYERWDQGHLPTCRLVITLHNTIVGWAALSPVSSRRVYAGIAEVSLYVDTNYSGKGLGTALLRALIAQSEQEGFWTLQSGILQENTASVRLHEKCGFRIIGYRERIAQDRHGIWHNTLLVERRKPD